MNLYEFYINVHINIFSVHYIITLLSYSLLITDI